MVERAQITVKGIVQGVGFRPYVYSLARSLGLRGSVANTAEGVLIDVEGARLPEFLTRLPKEAPLLSRITDVSVARLPSIGLHDFSIDQSRETGTGRPFTLVSPDVTVCPDCLRELFDPADRRYLYPFVNCTRCGPRYTITRSVPYDRPNTTMAPFSLCPECSREYHDPENRRFHAQPNACAACGPSVEFSVRSSESGVKGAEALQQCVAMLRSGGIVAIKGIGGFHLACDATNDEAVRKLRLRKRKSNKPFAIMAPDLNTVRQFCRVTDLEESLLESCRRPIVLLPRKQDGERRTVLSEAVAPGNAFIGCMLPYTPLHYLLFFQPRGAEQSSAGNGPRAHFTALVMTSGNLSEEPIVCDNDEAVQKLSGIVDAFLLHNRGIFMRVDDSVVRVPSADCGMRIAECGIKQEEKSATFKHSELHTPDSTPMFIRRSRGYAPEPIPLAADGPEVLGCGADLKNTFTLTKGAYAVPSQHIGDMENYETLRFFEESLDNLKAVYRVNPVAIAHDLHPGYLSTRWALGKTDETMSCRAARGGRYGTEAFQSAIRNPQSAIKRFAIQHHYAHTASVMAEHGLKGPVIGVAMDGTGYGTDGSLWGGEFLLADMRDFQRVAHFQYIPLPGGEAAIREPWRTAISFIVQAAGERAPAYLERTGFFPKYGPDRIEQIITISRARELSPLSSGAGRLFDAVSAMLGLCDTNTFEGEAAMALESAREGTEQDAYPVSLLREQGRPLRIDFSPAIMALLDDLGAGARPGLIADKFHATVAQVVAETVRELAAAHRLSTVALSGGSFQNDYLLRRCCDLIAGYGLNVHTNASVPPNDAGISLGQAYLAREWMRESLA